MIARLLQDRRGASAVEFALVAPVLLVGLLGFLEAGRMIWTKQALQSIAFDSARCHGLRSTSCASAGQVQSRVVSKAQAIGVQIPTGDVAVVTTNCRGMADFGGVTIEAPFSSPASGFVPAEITQIDVEACFPMRAASPA